MPNGAHYLQDGGVVFAQPCFDLGQLTGEFLILHRQGAEFDESPHHKDAHFHSLGSIQHRSRHDRPVFREGVGAVRRPPQLEVANCDFKFKNPVSER